MIEENAIVKGFLIDDDFRKTKDDHKYILLWSSKFHRLINRIMRKYDIMTLMKHSKYVKHFIMKIIKYFVAHGVFRSEVNKMSRYVYR